MKGVKDIVYYYGLHSLVSILLRKYFETFKLSNSTDQSIMQSQNQLIHQKNLLTTDGYLFLNKLFSMDLSHKMMKNCDSEGNSLPAQPGNCRFSRNIFFS